MYVFECPFRIPHEVFKRGVPLYTEAAILLAHIGDYLYAPVTGRKKGFHYSQIENQFKQQVETGEIKKISGIGDAIHNLLVQFLETGKIPYYERVRKDFLD